jgi:hypothetical protein
MIRHTAAALCKDDRAMLYNFIDSYMADSLHTVVERDTILPNIIYKVSIPMTEDHWTKYNQLLAVFGQAKGMHEMLAVGAAEFDRYTYIVDPRHTSEEHVEGWRALAQAGQRGMDMDALARELVQVWKGTWIEGAARYVGLMERFEQ